MDLPAAEQNNANMRKFIAYIYLIFSIYLCLRTQVKSQG